MDNMHWVRPVLVDAEFSWPTRVPNTRHTINRSYIEERQTPPNTPLAADLSPGTSDSLSDFRPSREFRAGTPQEVQPKRLLGTNEEIERQRIRQQLEAAAGGSLWRDTAGASAKIGLRPLQENNFNSVSVENLWKDGRRPGDVLNGDHTHSVHAAGPANTSTVPTQRALINRQIGTSYLAQHIKAITSNSTPFSQPNASSSSKPVQSSTYQDRRNKGPPTTGHLPTQPPTSFLSQDWRQNNELLRLDPVQPAQRVQRQFLPTTATRPQVPQEPPPNMRPQAPLQPPRQSPPQARPQAFPRVPPPQVRPQAPPQAPHRSPPLQPLTPQPQPYHASAPHYIPSPLSCKLKPARYPAPPGFDTRPGQFPPSVFEALLLDPDQPPVCPGCVQELRIDCPRSGYHWSGCTRGRWSS